MKFKYIVLSLLIFLSTNIYKVEASSLDNRLELILNDPKENYDIPEVSGQITNFPWRNDEDFIKAKEKYKTPILMAGFCAVLKNPLPGEEYNVSLAAKSIKGKVVKSSHIFSQNINIGPYTEKRGYKTGASYIGGNIVMTEGGGVCKIATTLYNLSVLSNLDIVERHHHSMPINYVPYGQDATVAYGVKDFRFKNTTDGNILIWSQLIGNRLYMGFYGTEHPPKIAWEHEISEVVDPSIKYVKNEDLEKGQMKTIIAGMYGAKVKSHINIIYKDGKVAIKNIGVSHYLPLTKLIHIN